MQDGDDEFAQKMDALASRIEASWMPREGMDEKEIGLMEHLHRIWRELNLSVPGCECGQCQVLDEDRLVGLMGCGSVFLGLTLFWQLGIVEVFVNAGRWWDGNRVVFLGCVGTRLRAWMRENRSIKNNGIELAITTNAIHITRQCV
jgi:hypothetical protein